jgi:Na+-translocating ferredoxin:NAD+ oxidoreductase subunit A
VSELILIIVSAALVNNLVLTQLLGAAQVLVAADRFNHALSLSLLSSIVLISSTMINYLIDISILQPAGITAIRLVIFIVIIGLHVMLLEAVLRWRWHLLHRQLGLNLLLVTANTGVLGTSLLIVVGDGDLIDTLGFAVGSAAGFSLVMLMFSAMQDRVNSAAVPLPFQGAAISIISAGLMALGFMGFVGLI